MTTAILCGTLTKIFKAIPLHIVWRISTNQLHALITDGSQVQNVPKCSELVGVLLSIVRRCCQECLKNFSTILLRHFQKGLGILPHLGSSQHTVLRKHTRVLSESSYYLCCFSHQRSSRTASCTVTDLPFHFSHCLFFLIHCQHHWTVEPPGSDILQLLALLTWCPKTP